VGTCRHISYVASVKKARMIEGRKGVPPSATQLLSTKNAGQSFKKNFKQDGSRFYFVNTPGSGRINIYTRRIYTFANAELLKWPL
jgi:hypothetical protein